MTYFILGSALLLFSVYLGYSLFLESKAPPDPVISPNQSAIRNAGIYPIQLIAELPIEGVAEYTPHILIGAAILAIFLAVVLIGYAFERRYA